MAETKAETKGEEGGAKGRVERHGRLILALVLVATFLVLLFATDRLLGAKASKPEVYMPGGRPKLERSLRIREWSPGSIIDAMPTIECTDGVERKTYRADLDAEGYIAPSHVHESPETTIVFYGGSTTECLFMAPEERFVYLAGRDIETKTGKRTNALNGGRSGNHTMHSVAQLIGKGIAEKPRIAVSHEAVNDLNVLLYYGTYWNRNPSRALVLTRPQIEELTPSVRRASSDLLRALVPNVYDALTRGHGGMKDEFADVRGTKLAWNKDAIEGELARAQRLFIRTSRIYGIEPVLMTQASLLNETPSDVVLCDKKNLFAMGIDYPTYLDLYRGLNDVTRRVAKDENVALVDLARAVPQEARYFYDAVHYTKEGSRLAATIIAATLSERLLAPPPPAE